MSYHGYKKKLPQSVKEENESDFGLEKIKQNFMNGTETDAEIEKKQKKKKNEFCLLY